MWNGYNFNGRSYIIVEAKMFAQSKIRRYGPPERCIPERRSESQTQKNRSYVSVEIQIFGWCAV